MTRRELFRRYAAEHFTAPDVPTGDRARCRGTVERQTSRARLASLARIAPRYQLPLPEAVSGGAAEGTGAVRIPAQRSCGDRPGGAAD
ncbi:hypothetical protein AB0O31_14815 [Kitasatospora cineracea]|uniref:hypothetical protein n=1 Tax=Kitasatospora cineracea TaxID=88074 RepID=UPI003435CACC